MGRKRMATNPDGKTVEVYEKAEIELFETPWWKLYWHRVDPTETPARFRWTARGKPEYPRGITIDQPK
jgi:hypothetical protein